MLYAILLQTSDGGRFGAYYLILFMILTAYFATRDRKK